MQTKVLVVLGIVALTAAAVIRQVESAPASRAAPRTQAPTAVGAAPPSRGAVRRAPALPAVALAALAAPGDEPDPGQDQEEDAEAADEPASAVLEAPPPPPPPPPQPSAIYGTVVDARDGEPMPGATVVAVSPALAGERVVISDEQGAYELTALPEGTYALTIYYAEREQHQQGVVVSSRYSTWVRVVFDQATDVRPIEVGIVEPFDDQAYVRNLPVARTFEGVLDESEITSTISFSSGCMDTNTYIVDGDDGGAEGSEDIGHAVE